MNGQGGVQYPWMQSTTPYTPVADTPTPVPVPATPKPAGGGAPAGTGGEFQTPATQEETQAPANTPLTLEQLRKQFLGEAGQRFGYNYSRDLVPDNLLDDTISSILSEQRGGAQQYLDRGKARGIYNDVGYGAGLAKIGTSAEAGRSQLGTAGQDILNKYRTQADKVREDAYGGISGLLDGQQFSLEPYATAGSAVGERARSFAGGDLRSTIGGQNFFDFGGLTNAAGQAQGAQNLRDTDVATALAERRRRASQGRGLGSQGDF